MKFLFFISIVLTIVLIGCHDTTIETPPLDPAKVRDLNMLERSVVSSDNSFGLKLFSRVNAAEQGKNFFISPFSVSMALGMTLNGADGATLDSMKQVLEHSNFTLQEINESYKNISYILTHIDPKVVFQIANSIWYKDDYPVLQKFLDDNRNYFDAEVSALDFTQPSALQTINEWVNTKTNGKIPTILDGIPPDAVMYLINAIYYKGTWTYQFDSVDTEEALFTCANGSTVSSKLMKQEETFAYYADAGIQAIDLPYGDRSFSMTIILPEIGTSIDQYAASLTQAKWDGIISKLDSAKVVLSLPRFKLEYKITLNDQLKAMGMGLAFSDFADFTRIVQRGGIMISKVLHKTFVEVNEEGTEAAAITAIEIIGTGSIEKPAMPRMIIDHPFIFAVREHKSGTILFIGKIVNPVE